MDSLLTKEKSGWDMKNKKQSGIVKTVAGLDKKKYREIVRSLYRRCALESGAVDAESFDQILDSARWTPSVANRQPWLISGLRGELAHDVLHQLSEMPGMLEDFFSARSHESLSNDLQSAGAMVLLMGQRTAPFWRESCLLATHQMMMSAAVEGLATRTLMPTSPNGMTKFFKIPDDYLAFSMILVGQPGEPEANTAMLKPVMDVIVPLKSVPQSAAV